MLLSSATPLAAWSMTLHGPTGFQENNGSLSETLRDLIKGITGPTVTLRELMDHIGEQGLLLVCAVASLPFLIPVSIPGVSTVFGAAIILVSLAITLNRMPWLPKKILDRQLDTKKLVPALEKGANVVSRLDRFLKPRLQTFTSGSAVNRLNGLAITFAGVLLMFPLGFVPFSNTLPGVAILLLSAGMLQRDGVVVLGGHLFNVITVIYFIATKLRDGGGLYLVAKGSGRYWIFNYTFAGLRREMGLGPLHTVGLADAREKAEEARKLVRQGKDPLAAKREAEEASPRAMTFGAYADEFIDAAVKAGRWRGGKTEARWRNLLGTHAKEIRPKAIGSIRVADVVKALKPLWGVKQETAEKLREAIERVLDAAKVEGHRSGDNPAAWKGNLEHVLHKPNELASRNHHAAMPHADVPTFMKALAKVSGVSARALELTILTGVRSGETRGAVWQEVDLNAKVWTIPAVRMKGGKLHRVPLSDEAAALLRKMKDQSVNDIVFPGVREKKPLSDMSLAKALGSAGGGAFTVHGFRSSFRDWATEVAHAPREIAEAALAHAVGDKVEHSGRSEDYAEMLTAAATRLEAGIQEHVDKRVQYRLRFTEPANDNKPYPGIISSGDFVRGFVPPDYHLDGVFQSRFFYSLTGTTGTGKTAVLLLLAAATAIGFNIGGREVKKGRVVYMAGENPDDVQMRWIAYGHHLGFDPADVDVHFLKGTTDVAETIELIRADVEKLGGSDLVIVDTSAAFFFGADENSNTDAGRHARSLRTLTTLPGEPAVLVATHPTKNAAADALLPRGGGAFIAEVDGNLTLSKSDGLVKLHWQGKHRGPDFEPVMFRLDGVTAPSLVDKRGRLVPTVLAKDMSKGEVVAVAATARRDEDDVLLQIDRDANASLSSIADELGWRSADGSAHKDRVRRATDKLRRDKLVTYEARKWKITPSGLDALVDIKADRHREQQAAQFASRAAGKTAVRVHHNDPHDDEDD
eukprot:g19985.t1